MCSRVTPSLSSISRCAPERSPVSMLAQNSRHSRGFTIGKTCTANVSVSMCCSHLLGGRTRTGSLVTPGLWGKPERELRGLDGFREGLSATSTLAAIPRSRRTAYGVRPAPIEARSARGGFSRCRAERGSEPAVLTDTWRASRMASRTDGGPRVLRAKGVEWPYVQPHGEDPQVAPARQDVLASPGRAKNAVGGAEE